MRTEAIEEIETRINDLLKNLNYPLMENIGAVLKVSIAQLNKLSVEQKKELLCDLICNLEYRPPHNRK